MLIFPLCSLLQARSVGTRRKTRAGDELDKQHAGSATRGIRGTKGSFHTLIQIRFFFKFYLHSAGTLLLFFIGLNLDQSWGLALPKFSWPVSTVLQNLTELSSLPVQMYTAADRRSQGQDEKVCDVRKNKKKNKERNSWQASELHFGKKGLYPSA